MVSRASRVRARDSRYAFALDASVRRGRNASETGSATESVNAGGADGARPPDSSAVCLRDWLPFAEAPAVIPRDPRAHPPPEVVGIVSLIEQAPVTGPLPVF